MTRPGAGLTTVASRTIIDALAVPGGRADAIAQRLGDAIRRGIFDDGERLPPEPELARQVQVATVTLREALATLREQGLVETRRGRGGGTFVRRPAGPAGGALARFSILDLRELGDHRAAVAGYAAAAAAERGVADEQDGLRRLLTRLTDATTAPERGRRDAQLVIAVAAAAQSARLTQAEVELRSELGDLLWLDLDDAAHTELVRRRRAELIAITARRATRARILAEEQVAAETRRLVALRVAGYRDAP